MCRLPAQFKMLTTPRSSKWGYTVGLKMSKVLYINFVCDIIIISSNNGDIDNVIIKASSWKLNVLTCTGCLLTYFTVIVYYYQINVWCNIHLLLICRFCIYAIVYENI